MMTNRNVEGKYGMSFVRAIPTCLGFVFTTQHAGVVCLLLLSRLHLRERKMVRVWYEPPPGGPRAHLNRGAYGVESAMEPLWVKKLARMRPVSAIVPAVGVFALIAYLPLSKYSPQR